MEKKLSEQKKEQLLQQIAEELRKKHEMELYKECLDIGSSIYEISKSYVKPKFK